MLPDHVNRFRCRQLSPPGRGREMPVAETLDFFAYVRLLQPTIHCLATNTCGLRRIGLRSPLMKRGYRQSLSRAQLSSFVVFCRGILCRHYLPSRSCAIRHDLLPPPRRPRTPAMTGAVVFGRRGQIDRRL